MESTAALLQSCLTALQRQTAAAFAAADFRPRIAVVLGSGLGFLQTVCKRFVRFRIRRSRISRFLRWPDTRAVLFLADWTA